MWTVYGSHVVRNYGWPLGTESGLWQLTRKQGLSHMDARRWILTTSELGRGLRVSRYSWFISWLQPCEAPSQLIYRLQMYRQSGQLIFRLLRYRNFEIINLGCFRLLNSWWFVINGNKYSSYLLDDNSIHIKSSLPSRW